jgi:hypothetical protein
LNIESAKLVKLEAIAANEGAKKKEKEEAQAMASSGFLGLGTKSEEKKRGENQGRSNR